MSEVLVEVNGETLWLDPAGALWWPAERTLVFADLHFEKGSAYARSGQMLPPYDTRATLSIVWGTRALPGRTAQATAWYRELSASFATVEDVQLVT